MPTIEEMFDIAEQSEAPSSLDAMFDVAEQEEEKKTAADVQRFGVEQPMRAISAIESALPVGLSVQNRLQRKEALQEEAGLARAEGAAGGVGLKAIELAQRTLEPLTPSGLMNQPARLIGRPDVYQAGQPLIQLPRPELRKGSAAAGMANLALGAVESMTTPEMIVTAPGLAASALARGAMAFDMARHIPEQVAQSAETLATPESTAQEKVEAIGAPLMSAFFAGALARGHVAKPKEIPLQTGKALEVPEGARTPRIEPPPGIQRATPAEAELAAKRMQRTATAAYEAPKPQKATVPEGPIEEIAPPAPETPQAPREIATWEDAVSAIRERAKGTETKEQIQALLPEIKLSREAAGNLAIDAFGENWKPGGQVRAPGPKPVEGLTPEQQAILAKGRTTTMSAEERALAERMMSGELERPSEAPQAPVAERTSESIEVQRKGQEEGRQEIAPIEPAPVEQPVPAPAPSPTPEAPAVPEPVQPAPLTANMESARTVLAMTPAEFAQRARSFNKTNLELGRKVSDAELSELEGMAAKANERWQQAKERAQAEKTPEAMDEMMALSSLPQYFNEAIAEAKRVRERKPDVAQGEGRVPSGGPPNREELRNVPEQGKGPGPAEANIPVQEKVTQKEPLLDWYETVKGERESLPIPLQRRLDAFESYARTLRSGLLPGGKKARGRELVLTREGAEHYKDLFVKEYASWKAEQAKPFPAKPKTEPKAAEGYTLTQIKRRLPVGYDESTLTVEEGKIYAKSKADGQWHRISLKKAESEAGEIPPSLKQQPATAAPVTSPKKAIAEAKSQVQQVASTEGQRPAKEVKSELVDRLEKALEEATSTTEEYFDGVYVQRISPAHLTDRPVEGTQPLKDWLETKSTSREADLNKDTFLGRKFVGEALERKGVPKITIEIPGDGTFTVWKTKTAIQELLEKARKISTKSNEPVAIKRSGTSKSDKEWIEATLKEKETSTDEGAQGAAATAASTPLQPSPVPALARDIKPISQIIRDIAKGLNVPIRFGRLRLPKYGGYYEPIANAIRVRQPNKVPIVSHEAGHRLDRLWEFSKDKAIASELDILGDSTTPGSMSSWTKSKNQAYKYGEGMAEFVRYWLTDPAQAKTAAPNTFAKFEQVLEANKDFGAVLRQAQTDIKTWKDAPQLARLRSHISTSNPNGARYGFSELVRDVADDLQFAKLFVGDAMKAGPVKASQNIYQLMRAYRGNYGMSDTWITKGTVDFRTREVTPGKSYKDALDPVRGRIDDFRAWLVAKRAMEYEARGKSTGINTADSRAVAAMFDKDPAFNEAAKRLAVWQDKLLQYSVDSGLISPESAKAMRAASAFYVPMHRIVEIGAGETGAQSSTGMGRGFKPGKPGSYQRVTGGEADIIDPLETMAKNAHVIVSAAEKNAINIALADLGARKDMGKWIQRVPAPKEKVLVDIEKIRKELVANGADLTGVPDDVVLTLWRDSRQAPFGENIIMVNRGGTREFYQVDSEIFKLFHALDAESSGLLLRYLAQPGQLLRSGVTLTPGFSTANAIRDTVSAAVISRYTVFPFEATLRGLGAMIRNPKMVSEWAASGGKQSVEASYFDRDALQRFLRERITKDLSPAEQALIVAKSPLTALRWFTGTLEEATRIGEYQVVLNKLLKQGMDIGEARRQAAYEARDLQDFAKGGAKTKVIRTLTPFWNASLQGNIRLGQAFKENPLATMLKGLAFITIPKMIEQAINWQDPDYWDRPQWERDLFFMLPIGRDENGRTRFARIPTPFEAGAIFGTIPGRILQHAAKNDPEAFRDLSSTILKSTVSNPIPQSLVTLGEVMAGKQGYSFWRGRPIVPESLKDEAPELRTTAQDSLAAKNLGEMLGIAPAKVEYTIQGLAGGLGKGATHNIIDPIIASITGQQRTAESKNLMGRFVASPAGSQSEAVERFYGLLEKARIDASKAKAGMQAGGYASLVTPLERMAKQMSELRKLARTAPTQAEKQRYQLRIADLSRQGLKLENQAIK